MENLSNSIHYSPLIIGLMQPPHSPLVDPLTNRICGTTEIPSLSLSEGHDKATAVAARALSPSSTPPSHSSSRPLSASVIPITPSTSGDEQAQVVIPSGEHPSTDGSPTFSARPRADTLTREDPIVNRQPPQRRHSSSESARFQLPVTNGSTDDMGVSYFHSTPASDRAAFTDSTADTANLKVARLLLDDIIAAVATPTNDSQGVSDTTLQPLTPTPSTPSSVSPTPVPTDDLRIDEYTTNPLILGSQTIAVKEQDETLVDISIRTPTPTENIPVPTSPKKQPTVETTTTPDDASSVEEEVKDVPASFCTRLLNSIWDAAKRVWDVAVVIFCCFFCCSFKISDKKVEEDIIALQEDVKECIKKGWIHDLEKHTYQARVHQLESVIAHMTLSQDRMNEFTTQIETIQKLLN